MKAMRHLFVSVNFLTLSIPSIVFALDMGTEERLREFLVRDQFVTNLDTLSQLRLESKELSNRPWSDTFWADFKGSIAAPYAEINFSNFPLNWAFNYQSTFQDRTELTHQAIDSLSEAAIADLAPSEKVDLLMGDRAFTLTHQIYALIDELEAKQRSAPWSGVCHGWTPASLNRPRPLHSFTVVGARGHRIKFYPTDIKALLSYSWGKSYIPARFEGFACQQGTPRTDHDLPARVVEPECDQVNPAFFHIALLNELGLHDRGLIMDRNYRREVQNQPIYKYHLKYFDPRRLVPSSSSEYADQARAFTVPLRSYEDPFVSYRSPRARFVVGVEAEVTFGMEVDPVHRDNDSPEYDNQRSLFFQYDLELDDNHQIVGGEWRGADRPDTLWHIEPDATTGQSQIALSAGDFDQATGNAYPDSTRIWDGRSPVPAVWKDAHRRAALNRNNPAIMGIILQPQVPAMVVEGLLRLSRDPNFR